jgi:hypothetical protein
MVPFQRELARYFSRVLQVLAKPSRPLQSFLIALSTKISPETG